MTIGSARPDDAPAIAEVSVRTWQQTYRGLLPDDYLDSLRAEEKIPLWESSIRNGNAVVFVSRVAGKVSGFVACGPSRDEDAPAGTGEIFAIYVLPACQGTGTGCQLMATALDQLRAGGFHSVTLWVIRGNAAARGFYEATGFATRPEEPKEFELGGSLIEEIRYWRTL